MADWLDLPMPWYDATLRLLVALICGGVVGFDREQRGHAAGLRTHMLIALGAAAFALVTLCLYEKLIGRDGSASQSAADPLRAVSAIVGGIGFLGAGAIIHHQGRAIGLTTAAGMWTVAAIGTASGLGFHLLALIITALAFITLALVRLVEPPMHSDEQKSRGTGR